MIEKDDDLIVHNQKEFIDAVERAKPYQLIIFIEDEPSLKSLQKSLSKRDLKKIQDMKKILEGRMKWD